MHRLAPSTRLMAVLVMTVVTGMALMAFPVQGAEPTSPTTQTASGGTEQPSAAYDPEAVHLQVEGAWARPGLSGGTSAVYLSLSHHGEQVVSIVGAETDAAAVVELHETILSPGGTGPSGQTMRMERVDKVTIAPGETVELRPGGLHIMLIGLNRRLADGDEVVVTLHTEDGGRVTFAAPVSAQGPGGLDAGHDHHHHHHDHHHDQGASQEDHGHHHHH